MHEETRPRALSVPGRRRRLRSCRRRDLIGRAPSLRLLRPPHPPKNVCEASGLMRRFYPSSLAQIRRRMCTDPGKQKPWQQQPDAPPKPLSGLRLLAAGPLIGGGPAAEKGNLDRLSLPLQP
ncbi:hypothetical protein MRX96_038005 [Rhipicephalus microplus]